MRLVAPALLLLPLSGCYLFSDEPKSRKQPGSEAGEAPTEVAPPITEPLEPTSDCPSALTGVEAQARTIAASCGPVRVRGQYRIDGGSLTLEAGVELRFEPGAVLEVGRDRPGVLTVAGTPERPVRLRAEADDAGSWQGLRLHARASGSSLKQLEITGAGTSTEAALWIAADDVAIEALTIRSAPALALEVVAERGPALLGVELSGTGVVARVSPSAAAGLQELKLEPTAFVAVSAGKIANTIEWPPNPTRVEGVVRIEGDAERPASLTLAPGAKLYFTPEARLIVGGFGPGSLNASASPEQDPAGAISLRAAEDSRAGSWSGIHVQDHGELILRHVELAHGGARDEGVVLAEGDARVTLEGCEFVDNLVGIELRGEAVTLAGFSANGFANTPVAVRMPPTLLAGLGADNRYDDHATLEVTRGRLEADATWATQAAPIVILGDLFVDKGATLTVAPGSRLRFAPGVVLGVGYYERASLDMRASVEAPILLEPARDRSEADAELRVEPQPWGGVVLGAHAHKARFEHVKLYATANAAGIELRETAEATLVNVECTACAGATVTWGCKSKIGNIGVTAGPGTPKPMAAPTCR